MSRWFRHYAGMMRDDKLVRVAIKAAQPIERVVWVWGAILESAAEIDDGGKFEVDAAEISYFLRADQADVVRILEHLESLGRVCASVVVKWGDRQFQSDRSADRQRRHRDKRRATGDVQDSTEQTVTTEHSDDTVTSQPMKVTATSRHSDAPDTETELEPEAETEKVAAQPSARVAEKPPAKVTAPTPQELAIPVALRRGQRTTDWFDQVEREARAAAGLSEDPSPALLDVSPLVTLIDQGFDFGRDILPKLRAAKAAGKHGRTWAYYVPAITEGKAANGKIAPKTTPSGKPADVWVRNDDPRWPTLARQWSETKGKPPPALAGSHGNTGQGWHFPKTMLAEIH